MRIITTFLNTKTYIMIPQKQNKAFQVNAKSARNRNLFCGAASEEQPVAPLRAAIPVLPRFSVFAFPYRSCSSCSREAHFRELLEMLFPQALKISSA